LSERELAAKKRLPGRLSLVKYSFQIHYIQSIENTRFIVTTCLSSGAWPGRGLAGKDVKDRFGAPPPERRKAGRKLVCCISIF